MCTDSTTLPISGTLVDAAVANNGYLTATSLVVTTLQSDVTALKTAVTGHTSAITTLQSDMTTAKGNITTLQGQIGGISVAAGNLTAQYEFNETSGTNLVDSSPFGATATINSGGVLVGAGGHAGNSVSFADKGILVGANNKIPDSAQIWVEAWVQPQLPITQNRVVIDKVGAYKLRQNSGGIVEFTVTGVNGVCAVQHPTPVVAGVWAHVAGSYDGQFISVEVNGAPYSIPCTKGPVAPTATGVMAIGGTWNGSAYVEGFKGEIDEVRVRPTANMNMVPAYLAPPTCPVGMVSVGAGAARYCIDDNKRTAAYYDVALRTCLNAGAELQSEDQWMAANGTFTETLGTWEWTSTSDHGYTSGHLKVLVGGNTAGLRIRTWDWNGMHGNAPNSQYAYRCVIGAPTPTY